MMSTSWEYLRKGQIPKQWAQGKYNTFKIQIISVSQTPCKLNIFTKDKALKTNDPDPYMDHLCDKFQSSLVFLKFGAIELNYIWPSPFTRILERLKSKNKCFHSRISNKSTFFFDKIKLPK